MSGALRIALRRAVPLRHSLTSACPRENLLTYHVSEQKRWYASKTKKKGKDSNSKENSGKQVKDALDDEERARSGRGMTTDKLVPGSEQVLSGEALTEYERADGKMKTAVDWFRREAAGKELQGSGRVTPDILKPVRVSLPDAPNGETCALTKLATVGVREGTTLLVTVFAEDTLKHAEKAIYAAKIPHIVPQRLDSRTIKIPLPKPTVDARVELVKSAAKLAEETRVQLRRIEQISVKKGGYGKHSVEVEEFRDLLQGRLEEVDEILAGMKKSLGVK